MKLRQYQVDAFASRVFEGNPAAVVPLESWLDDAVLQAIAGENNLSETAFFVPSARGFRLRWFTPVAEVDLCGHATLAAAHALFEHLGVRPPGPFAPPEALLKGLGRQPVAVLAADDYVAVFDSEADIRSISPDHTQLGTLDLRGVVVTAWAARLGTTRLKARQLSRRGGELLCELTGDRVLLSGRAVTFMEAEIVI